MKSTTKGLLALVLVLLTQVCMAKPINLQDLMYRGYIAQIKIGKFLIDHRGKKPSEAVNQIYDKIEAGEYIVDGEVLQTALDYVWKVGSPQL